MKNIVHVYMGAVLALSATTAPGISKYECRISFPHDSTDFSSDDLKACYSDLKRKPDYLYVFATSSPDGSGLYNLRLSERRAAEVSRRLKELFPETGIESHGGGINPGAGRSARVVAVVSDRQPEPEGTTGTIEKVVEAPEPRGYSLAALGGLYSISGYRYSSAGAEFSGLHPWQKSFSWSYGIRAMVHANDEALSLSSLAITPGTSLDMNPVQVGLKFPVGLVFSGKERRADAGVELSLGSVWQDYLCYGLAAGTSSQFDSYISLHTAFRL